MPPLLECKVCKGSGRDNPDLPGIPNLNIDCPVCDGMGYFGIEFPPVLTKADFTERYRKGEYGNHSPTWGTLAEFLSHGRCGGNIAGLYHLRNRVAGGETHYRLDWSTCVSYWAGKENSNQWYCSEQVPPDVEESLLIQGEVMQAFPGSGRCGLELFYTTVKKPMREALATRAESVSGIISSSLLRQNLDANSYDWLMELLIRYPQHVVEFSSYGKCWGTLWPLYKTVFWECRLYIGPVLAVLLGGMYV